jgi:hypothetical protein
MTLFKVLQIEIRHVIFHFEELETVNFAAAKIKKTKTLPENFHDQKHYMDTLRQFNCHSHCCKNSIDGTDDTIALVVGQSFGQWVRQRPWVAVITNTLGVSA